jgi:hypothetical protein
MLNNNRMQRNVRMTLTLGRGAGLDATRAFRRWRTTWRQRYWRYLLVPRESASGSQGKSGKAYGGNAPTPISGVASRNCDPKSITARGVRRTIRPPPKQPYRNRYPPPLIRLDGQTSRRFLLMVEIHKHF